MSRSFGNTLKDHNLSLTRGKATTLQVNVGLLCNLACKHCHVHGGPARREVMSRETMDDVIAFAAKNSFELADITGGAPEMVPDLIHLLDGLRPHVAKIILRSNLTLLLRPEYGHILEWLIENRAAIAASFPSANKNQTNSQRGDGTWQQTIEALKQLNSRGYGLEGSGLELILVSNPTGAFMPPDQCVAEKKFKRDLSGKWGIEFNQLFTFANMPLGRFREWLEKTGNYQTYLTKLAGNFNPSTIDGLMCRSLISISWEGLLYDCDFNLAAGLPHGGRPVHVRDVDNIGEATAIATDNHCYGCTAGAGFT